MLSGYLNQEALEIERLSERLNEHGFELQHTLDEVAPKLETIATFLQEPLVAAIIPWLLRRVLARPYRRRH